MQDQADFQDNNACDCRYSRILRTERHCLEFLFRNRNFEVLRTNLHWIQYCHTAGRNRLVRPYSCTKLLSTASIQQHRASTMLAKGGQPSKARANARIEARKSKKAPGWISFFDVTDTIVSKYPTVRSKGVYYIQNMTLEPARSAISNGHTANTDAAAATELLDTNQATTPHDNTQRIAHTAQVTQEWSTVDDFRYDGTTSTFHDYIVTPTGTPTVTQLLAPLDSTSSNAE